MPLRFTQLGHRSIDLDSSRVDIGSSVSKQAAQAATHQALLVSETNPPFPPFSPQPRLC